MSKSTKGIWLVVAAGIAAGVAFAVYYITVAAPRADARKMQKEIRTWSSVWEKTRACLVGEAPEAASGYDAIILREAITGTGAQAQRPCAGLFGELARPGDSRSENADVETDWEDLKRSLTALANAHALRIDRNATQDAEKRREGLGTALETVDAAYAKLRRDAKLAAFEPAGRGRIREVEAPPTVAVDGKSLPPNQADRFGNTLLVQGPVDGVTTLAVVKGPTSFDIRRIAKGVERAASSDAWGAWRAETKHVRQIRAGGLGADGKALDKGTLVASTDRWRETLDIVFGLGEGQTRLVIYWVSRETPKRFIRTLWASRSRDGGATFPEQLELDPGDGSRVTIRRDWGGGRLDLLWRGDKKPLRWLALRPGQLDAPLTPMTLSGGDAGDEVDPPKQCHSGATTWWAFRGARKTHLHVVGSAKAPQLRRVSAIDGKLTACTQTKVLIESFTPRERRLSVCDATACGAAVAVPVARGGSFRATIGAKLGPIAVTLTNDLLVLWSAHKQLKPTHVLRLAEPGKLHSLYEWNGVAHAVIEVDDALHLIAFTKA